LTGVLEEALVALFKGVRDVCVGAGASTIVPVEQDVIGAARLDEDGDPILWDGIDAQLGITEKELASWFEPLRLAIGFTRKDHHAARQAMRNILDDPDGLGKKMIEGLFHDWTEVAQSCKALADLVRAAHNRALISLYVVAPDHPQQFELLDFDA
jgi:hypothetical protein